MSSVAGFRQEAIVDYSAIREFSEVTVINVQNVSHFATSRVISKHVFSKLLAAHPNLCRLPVINLAPNCFDVVERCRLIQIDL